MKGDKPGKPLGLGFSFDDALRRLINTSPAELAESIEAEKKDKGATKKLAKATEKEGRLGPS